MKINAVNEYRTEVDLPSEELARLGIRCETLDWENADTRRAVCGILGGLREQGLAPLPGGRLLIEAVLLKNGLRLCFTSLQQKRKRAEKCQVLRCETRKAAVAAAGALGGSARLFKLRDAWFLPVEGTYGEAALSRAAEFGTLYRLEARLALPLLEEYCLSAQ